MHRTEEARLPEPLVRPGADFRPPHLHDVKCDEPAPDRHCGQIQAPPRKHELQLAVCRRSGVLVASEYSDTFAYTFNETYLYNDLYVTRTVCLNNVSCVAGYCGRGYFICRLTKLVIATFAGSLHRIFGTAMQPAIFLLIFNISKCHCRLWRTREPVFQTAGASLMELRGQ